MAKKTTQPIGETGARPLGKPPFVHSFYISIIEPKVCVHSNTKYLIWKVAAQKKKKKNRKDAYSIMEYLLTIQPLL